MREPVRSKNRMWICILPNMKLSPMKESEIIQEINTRFTSITNELHYFGKVIPPSKQVRNILGVLPKSWESKINVILKKEISKFLPWKS